MKHLCIFLSLLAGCATTPRIHKVYIYDIPAHKLIVCDNWTRQQLFPMDRPLRGKCFIFAEPSTATPHFANPYTYTHEVRHFVDGNYHK